MLGLRFRARRARPRAFPGRTALTHLALLVAATAWLAGGLHLAPAAAQSSAQDEDLNPQQRRILIARLRETMAALQRDIARGRQLLQAEIDKSQSGGVTPALKSMFQKSDDRAFLDSSANAYQAAIKEYVSFKREGGPDVEWNGWPAASEKQLDYAKCVEARIDYVFDSHRKYMGLLIDSIAEGTDAPALNAEGKPPRAKAIQGAVTFKGSVRRFLNGVAISERLPLPDATALDDPLNIERRCPLRLDDLGGAAPTGVHTEPLSVDWNAKCLQSDKLQADGTTKPYHPTAAALMYDNGRTGPATYCSGTLIAPNAVLTAAHCVCETGAKEPNGPFYQTAAECTGGAYPRRGGWVSTLDPRHHTVFLQHAGHLDVARVVVHPQFRWTGDVPFADLAILFLKAPVRTIAPMPLNSLRRLPANTRAASVGFGAHNPIGATGDITDLASVEDSAGLKLQATIDTGFCTPRQRARRLICWRYQPADRSGLRLGSTCRGDSGGPLYADSGSQTYLVGVTSGGGPSCQPESSAFDTEVYAYKDWIAGELALSPAPAAPGRDRIRQVLCHFCPLCDMIDSPIKVPPNAHRLRVSANCTPDDVTRFSKLKLSLSIEGEEGAGTPCPIAEPVGTAASCSLGVQPGQQVKISLSSGTLQQCQIVATALDGAE
jgi:hypothetical protein